MHPAFRLLALLIAALPSAVSAQVVSGKLLESGSGAPVVLGQVALLDTTGTVVESTWSDHDGAFLLRAPGPGAYLIAAFRLGYQPVVDGIIELGENGFLPVHLYMKLRPVELPEVTATVRRERVERKLVNAGFYDRAKSGFGHFVTPEEIRKRPPADVPDLLRRIPGPQFVDQGVHGNIPLFRARGRAAPRVDAGGNPTSGPPAGYCFPALYMDGVEVWSPNIPTPPPPIEEVVAVEDIVGVEVYAGGATKPLQWGGSEGNCGIIVFWTGG